MEMPLGGKDSAELGNHEQEERMAVAKKTTKKTAR
jgi:hypothetical protein